MGSKPNTTYALEFFASRAPDPSGHGEGEAYLGSTEVTTAETGVAAFELQLPPIPATFAWITATATDPEGNTSTFSPALQARSTTFLQIHSQPTGVSSPPGLSATFRVDVSGAPPILYQWRQNGLDLPGATNSVLTLTNVQAPQRGFYSVQIRNPLGTVESLPAELVVLIGPVFVQDPIGQTISPGESVTLSAVVTDTAALPLGFRWRSNTTFISSSISTQYATFLTVHLSQTNTSFSVVVTNAALPSGHVSRPAVITMVSDRDHDGLPDDYEIASRLDPDDPTDANKDADGDGMTNRQEYLAGTDPRDATSYLKIQRISSGPAGTALEFATASNKTYSVQSRDAVEGAGWRTWTNLPAWRTNGVAVVVDGALLSQRYYRVVTPKRP